MNYMLLLHVDENAGAARTAAETQALMAAYGRYTEELEAAGILRGGEALQPSAQGGASVTVRQGKRRVLDGPFAETREVVGGFYLIDVATRDEAIEWASRCPAALHGRVDVRAVMTAR